MRSTQRWWRVIRLLGPYHGRYGLAATCRGWWFADRDMGRTVARRDGWCGDVMIKDIANFLLSLTEARFCSAIGVRVQAGVLRSRLEERRKREWGSRSIHCLVHEIIFSFPQVKLVRTDRHVARVG